MAVYVGAGHVPDLSLVFSLLSLSTDTAALSARTFATLRWISAQPCASRCSRSSASIGRRRVASRFAPLSAALAAGAVVIESPLILLGASRLEEGLHLPLRLLPLRAQRVCRRVREDGGLDELLQGFAEGCRGGVGHAASVAEERRSGIASTPSVGGAMAGDRSSRSFRQ
jgi:hypothetical protein